MHILRQVVLATLILTAAAASAQMEYDLPLDHLRLRWDPESLLSVTCDGRTLFAGTRSPVVAYPNGWTWSYQANRQDTLKATLAKQGNQQVLTVTCADEKLPWREIITAGPGDRFRIEYFFMQRAWDEPMNSEVNAAIPTTTWFVGSQFKVKTPAGEKTGEIPFVFAGASNPFGGATSGEFSSFFGKLTFNSTAGLTLFDYAHRKQLWLGRDASLPKGEQQKWAVEFAYEPQPYVIGGVEVSRLEFTDRLLGERLDFGLSLRRVGEGPKQVTARLSLVKQPEVKDERAVALTDKATPAKLSLALPGPGTYPVQLALLDGEKQLYQSPPLTITVPRLVGIRPGRVPYTPTDAATVLVQVAEEAGEDLTVQITGPAGKVAEGAVKADALTVLPLKTEGLPVGQTPLTAELYRKGQKLGSARCDLTLATPTANGVVIDNRSQTLLVGGLPFCPQSCYADLRSVDDVIRDEPVFGFNTIAPYLPTNPEERHKTRESLRKMFDRCAEVGLYVQLCLHGAARPPHTEEKWAWLKEEIEAFRDHPALLAYYLADEPELGSASAEDCEIAYRKIKELDPWHPVTMVFCQSEAAARYARGMDICMTDPYPIPNSPVTNVSDFCDRINRDLADALPLWVVPQAFGGGEWWKREPSRQEMRCMTYLALIHNSRGIQYFIRRPPASNPNSPDLWSECRRLMFELGQLTPALAGEQRPAPTVNPAGIHTAAFGERGAVTVLCTNTKNEPQQMTLTLADKWSVDAEVVFENRQVRVTDGVLTDTIEPFGTRVYRLQVAAAPADLTTLNPKSLIVNPSWEEMHNVGTPDGCYIGYGADKSASWYVDPRTAAHGRQSLRLRTPVEGQGIGVQPFPVRLTAKQKYRLSIWARGEREGQQFSFAIDTVKGEEGTHALTTDWREYTVEFVASDPAKPRLSASLRLISAGSAWFDALQLVPID
ncbi:MAG: hypothetical protein ABFD96_10745 [Armatimonadia bacterium]